MRMTIVVGWLIALRVVSPVRADDAAEIKALLRLLEKRLVASEE